MEILGTTDIMSVFHVVFDIVLIALGIYIMYAAVKMKKTGKPMAWLVEEQETKKCKDNKGFIDTIYMQTVLLGGVVFLYGAVSTLNRYLLKIDLLNMVPGIVFLVVCGIYMTALNKAKKKFF